MKEIGDILREFEKRRSESLALATLVRAQGSSYRRPGARDTELFAPAGLELGAETPEEIALAIVAEIQSVFAAASGESLRNRKVPIHALNYVPREAVATTR